MSFDTMKLPELKKVAEDFGVDITGAKTKAEVIAALAEEGVNFDLLDKFTNVEKEDLPEAPMFDKLSKVDMGSDTALVKMERLNRSYETFGFTFSQDHPFVPMPMHLAQEIFDNEEGFRLATPREVNEFYS